MLLECLNLQARIFWYSQKKFKFTGDKLLCDNYVNQIRLTIWKSIFLKFNLHMKGFL